MRNQFKFNLKIGLEFNLGIWFKFNLDLYSQYYSPGLKETFKASRRFNNFNNFKYNSRFKNTFKIKKLFFGFGDLGFTTLIFKGIRNILRIF